jgi:predicted ArsR family transcriptional regulator
VSHLQQQARALGDPTRHALFGMLVDAEAPLTVGDLAHRTGLHHNAVRQHLTTLVEAGLVEAGPGRSKGRGRPARTYAVAPAADGRWGARGPYERLAVWLGEMVRSGAEPEEVGRQVGRGFRSRRSSRSPGPPDPVAVLEEGMAREGFAPERRDSDGSDLQLVLAECPFAEAAAVVPEPVCRFHLGYAEGLVQGVAGLVVEELIPSEHHDGGCLLRCHLDAAHHEQG